MKNLNKILISSVVILFLFSATSASMNSGYNTESENLEYITLNFTFPKPKIEKIEVNNEICDRVTINELPNSGELNQPRLPVKSVKLLMPYGRELDFVNVVAKEKSLVGLGYNVELGHNIIPLESNAAPQDNNEKHDKVFPEKVYSIVGTHTFKGYTVLFLNLHPVQYNKDNGEILYYKDITLEVKTKESLEKTFIRGLQKDKDIVTKLVDNPSCIMSYNDAPVSTSRDTVEYVIITNEELKDAAGDYTFQNLVQSKIDKGMSADIFTVESIVNNSNYSVNGTWGDNNPDNPFYDSVITANFSRFNDTQAKIRNFIRYAYTELGTDYVLLGGDADVAVPEENIIPLRGLYACEVGLPLDTGTLDFEEDDIPSDVYYACLDGNYNYDMDERWGENATNNNISNVEEADLLAEIYIGRACVDADDEVSNFVMKTLAYENSDEEPYLVKALMVGEYLGFPGVSVYGGNYKDLIIPLIPDDYYVDTLYEREGHWGKSDIIKILNTATPHLLNHLGHGFVDYALKLDNSDILSLTNDKYFFIYSQTCLAGSFDNCYRETYYTEDCAAEHFTVETPNGAFAVIMNSRFGLGSEDTLYSPSQVLDESFFTALFNESIRELGRANHYSKEDHIWHINENGIRWVYYETNLFGDPEVSIKDSCPSSVVFNITFTCPENSGSLYILGKKIFSFFLIKVPFLIGRTTMQVEAVSDPEGQVFSVEFYLDNESQHVDYEAPYEYNLNTFLVGRHKVTAEVNGIYGGKESKSIDVVTFILGK